MIKNKCDTTRATGLKAYAFYLLNQDRKSSKKKSVTHPFSLRSVASNSTCCGLKLSMIVPSAAG